MTNQTNPPDALQTARISPKAYEQFADGVTALAERLGIGIEGGILYEMEGEDFAYRYKCDHQSRLIRG